MTFKHDKFDDSPVMRSLEKVAKDKGWVESKPITKSASTKLNLKPSSNLTDNILKLCSGLKAAGLDKYATDIENKFVAYKQAATMYDTHGETGEDLVHAAHPKGSHHLEGLDDAVVKTILDKHLDMVNMVNKKPTGKLSNASDILNEVKVVLGGSFLANGKGNGSRKIAQESSSGIGTEIAGAGATMGGLALLKFVVNKLRAAKALDAQTIKAVESQMARKLTDAEADVIRKQVLSKVSKEAMSKTFGAAAKEVAKDAGSAVAKSVPNAASAAVKSPGMWSKVVSLFGRTATLPGGAGAAAAGGTTGTEVAGGAVVGAGGTAAAALAAGVVAATGTYLITSAIYENKFYSAEIKEAGDKLLSELKDIEKMQEWQTYSTNVLLFRKNFNAALAAADEAKEFINNPTAASLNALKTYADTLQDASTQAYNISSAARQVFTGDKMAPGESMEDSGGFISDSLRTSPIARLLQSDSPQVADVIIMGSNFVNAAQKALVEVRMAMNKVMDINAKAEASAESKKVVTEGGKEAASLTAAYKDATDKIAKFRAKISAKELKNAPALNAYLDKISNYIASQKSKFDAANENKEVVAPDYKSRLDTIITPKLNEFESLYGK